MRTILFFIGLLSFNCISANAQVAQTAMPRDVENKKQIDNSTLAITYRVKIATDTTAQHFYCDNQVLEIGKIYSRYYSAFAEEIDSTKYKVRNGIIQSGDGLFSRTMTLGANEDGTYEDILINFPKLGINTVYTRFLNKTYVYQEPTPTFKWTLTSVKDTILGYECQMAETLFRGRKYVAWFAVDIPISVGPWKLNGLPGLILKAMDGGGLFQFNAIGIEKHNKQMYMYETKAVKCNRKDVVKLNDLRWSDFDLLVQTISGQQVMTINTDGQVVNRKEIIPPYIPQLELE